MVATCGFAGTLCCVEIAQKVCVSMPKTHAAGPKNAQSVLKFALLRERAVGRQQIMMYWHVGASLYRATIAAFDELHYVHRVEHDDGDIEPAVKLWQVQVQLTVRIHSLTPLSRNVL